MKTDIIWLDYTRFMGIFLVIFAHSLQRIPNWDESSCVKGLWDYIYLFHMPLFFIISGFLYKKGEGDCKNKGIQILHKLIVPYVLYQLIYLPICLIHYRENLLNGELWRKLLMGLAAGDGYNTFQSVVICLPCWFIMCIIQLRILFLFVHINKTTSVFFPLLSIIILVSLNHYDFDMYFCIDSTIMAIPYFILGNFIAKTKVLERVCKKQTQISLLAIFGLAVFILMKMNGPAQMNGPSYGNNIFLNYLAGIMGSMMVVMASMFISSYLQDNGVVKKLSRNTLFLIFSHWLLLYPGYFIMKKIFETKETTNPIVIIIIAMLVTIVILWVSKKMIEYGVGKIPYLFGKYQI